MLRARGSGLAGVIACSVWLTLALGAPPAVRRRCSKDLLPRVEGLRGEAGAQVLDWMLYTPSIQDFENCPRTTLKCYAAEVEVLSEELAIISNTTIGRTIIIMLKKLAWTFSQVESGCPQCELFPERNSSSFFSELVDTLKMVNARNCPTETPAQRNPKNQRNPKAQRNPHPPRTMWTDASTHAS
ncbi:interleukin 15, like [Menidia menidia]